MSRVACSCVALAVRHVRRATWDASVPGLRLSRGARVWSDVNRESTKDRGRTDEATREEREGQRATRRGHAGQAPEEKGSERAASRDHNRNATRQPRAGQEEDRRRGDKRASKAEAAEERAVRESGRVERVAQDPLRVLRGPCSPHQIREREHPVARCQVEERRGRTDSRRFLASIA